MADTVIAGHRGRLPHSEEVLGTDPQGSESPDSMAARQRFVDRISPDAQVDAASLSQIAGSGGFDNRKIGEPLPAGEPPVGAQKTSSGVSALQTMSALKLRFDGSVTHGMVIGAELVLGSTIGFVPELAQRGREPSQWSTTAGLVDSWTYDAPGGTWHSNAWSGVVVLGGKIQIKSGAIGVVLSSRWEYVSNYPTMPFVWSEVDREAMQEFDQTDSPQPMAIGLNNVGEAVIAEGVPQRLIIRRETGGPVGSQDITVDYVRLTVGLPQLVLPP